MSCANPCNCLITPLHLLAMPSFRYSTPHPLLPDFLVLIKIRNLWGNKYVPFKMRGYCLCFVCILTLSLSSICLWSDVSSITIRSQNALQLPMISSSWPRNVLVEIWHISQKNAFLSGNLHFCYVSLTIRPGLIFIFCLQKSH